jgi:hypothetical protein
MALGGGPTEAVFGARSQRPPSGETQAEERPVTTVWIYVDTSKDVGNRDHLKVFADQAAAEAWFRKHDPEGVAFEYPSIKTKPPLGADQRRLLSPDDVFTDP